MCLSGILPQLIKCSFCSSFEQARQQNWKCHHTDLSYLYLFKHKNSESQVPRVKTERAAKLSKERNIHVPLFMLQLSTVLSWLQRKYLHRWNCSATSASSSLIQSATGLALTVWPLLETRQFWEQKTSPNSAWIWKFPVLGTHNLALCPQYGPRANHFLITAHGADFSFHSDRHQSEKHSKTLLRLQLIHPSYWSCWIHWSCCNCKSTDNWEMPKCYACLGISRPRNLHHLAAVHAWRQQRLTSCEKRWMHSPHLAGWTLLLLERNLLCSWASSQRARTQILPHTFSVPLFSATQSLRSALYLSTIARAQVILLCQFRQFDKIFSSLVCSDQQNWDHKSEGLYLFAI